MSTVEQVQKLVNQKRDKFLEYEQVTKELLACEPDTAEHYIIERDRIATEIDALTEEIGALCDEEENGDLLMNVAASRVNFKNVPPEFHPVFEAAQEMRSAAHRLVALDEQVVQRLESFQRDAIDKIRENQNLPKIKKYLDGLTDKPAEKGYLRTGKA